MHVYMNISATRKCTLEYENFHRIRWYTRDAVYAVRIIGPAEEIPQRGRSSDAEFEFFFVVFMNKTFKIVKLPANTVVSQGRYFGSLQ